MRLSFLSFTTSTQRTSVGTLKRRRGIRTVDDEASFGGLHEDLLVDGKRPESMSEAAIDESFASADRLRRASGSV